MTDMDKMKSLVEELNKASEAYYSDGQELMSDYEWNVKFDELEALERKLGIVLDDSPTNNVSHETDDRPKERHEYPALSLPKSKNVSDLVKWASDKETVLSWKLDGLTLVVTYDDGKLTKIVKRGDGEYGTNITHLAKAINNLPETITYTGHLVIRGEALISYDDFERINDECNQAYKNARNLASGTCNAITVDEIMGRNLIWIPFTLVHVDEPINSWRDRMQFLENLGFQVVEHEFVAISDEIENAIEYFNNKVETMRYPVDGLVLVYDDTDYASKGTLTGHHDTRGGFAFKWKDEVADSVLQDIEWSVSIHSINPVAIFEPVELEGTTVKRASLCNISECERLGIGDVGTKVSVIKANKIIPKIVKAETVGELHIPENCPICKAKTKIKMSNKTKTLVCTNSDCPAKNISKMERFAGRYGFDIKGLSNKKLMQLLNLGLIKSSIDIIKLVDKKDEVYDTLSKVDGWGEKSVSNLLAAIESSKKVKADNFLYALCIPMCGRDISKKLTKVKCVETICSEAILDAINETTNVATNVDGFGVAKLKSFIDWFKADENVTLIQELMMVCDIQNTGINNGDTINSKLNQLTFVVTGSLSVYENREILKELIESMGGKVSGSVSSKTSYLINNDVNSTSGKNKKAKELGVPIISEQDFIDKFLSN